ncbi:MAG: helix-turn-helix transcriptional regulator [Rhodoluna sp.]|jgi:proteasome accessory factor B
MDDLDPNEYKIGKPERLFNLTCLLLHFSNGISKNDILRSIPAYSAEYVEGGDNSSLERKFERDKDELRETGIMVEAVIAEVEDQNNQATKYVIRSESFFWPKGLSLTPRQLALLNLAADAWAGGSLSAIASKGINKLRAMGEVNDGDSIIGIAPRLNSNEPNLHEIGTAINERRVIEFDYRKPSTGEIMPRSIEPWLLRQIAGQWLVLGYDRMRNAPRNFMLRRMVSNVKIARGTQPFDPPNQSEIDNAIADLEKLAAKQVAVIKVEKNTEAWFRYELDLGATSSSGKVELNFYDMHVLAEQLREYAGQIQVIKPDDLAALVRDGFQKVADQHG